MSDQTLENSLLEHVWSHCQVAVQNLTSAASPAVQFGWRSAKRMTNTVTGSFLNDTVLSCIVRSEPVRTGLHHLAKSAVLSNAISIENITDNLQQTWQSASNSENARMLAAAATAAAATVSGLAIIHRYRKRVRSGAGSSIELDEAAPVTSGLEDTSNEGASYSPKRQRRMDGERTIESLDDQMRIIAAEDNQHAIHLVADSDSMIELKQCIEQSKMDLSLEVSESKFSKCDSSETSSDVASLDTCEIQTIQVLPSRSNQFDATKSADDQSNSSQLLPMSDDDSNPGRTYTFNKHESSEAAVQILLVGSGETGLDQGLIEKQCMDQSQSQVNGTCRSNIQDELSSPNASSASSIVSTVNHSSVNPAPKMATPVAVKTCASAPVTVTKSKTLSYSRQEIARAHSDANSTNSSATVEANSAKESASGLVSPKGTAIPINNVTIVDTKGMRLAPPTSPAKSRMIPIHGFKVTPIYGDQEGCSVTLNCKDENIRSIQFNLGLNFHMFKPEIHLKGVASVKLRHSISSTVLIPLAGGVFTLIEAHG